MSRRNLACILFAGALFVPLAWAAPCSSDSLAAYVGLTNGCTIGTAPTFTFSNFAFSVLNVAGGPTVLTPSQIMVTPTYKSAEGALELTFSSSGFSVGGGQMVQYLISYTVDPPPPEVIRFDLSFATDPPVYPGIAQVNTNLCVYALFNGTACNGTPANLTVFDNGMMSQFSDTTPNFSPVAILLGVQDSILLDGDATASASFTSFENTSFIIGQVPEPATAVLCGLGVALLLLLMRQTRTKTS